MNTRWHAARAWLIVGASVLAFQSLRAFELTKDGRAVCNIVIAVDAPPAERHAAEELQRYVEKISGARLALTSTAEAGKPAVLIGARELDVPARSPDDDAFVIRVIGDRLLLKGASPRGTLYATYALLERFGCVWFTPAIASMAAHHELVPKRPTIAIEDTLELTERPLMRYRKRDADLGRRSHSAANWPPLFEWFGKQRTNVFAIALRGFEEHRALIRDEARRRGMMLYVGQHDVMPHFLSREKYFSAHPEWFGLIDGKRVVRAKGRAVVFETANADAMRTFQDNVIAYLRERPEIDVLQLWPPDVAWWSESPESRALGEPSERMARLVQQVTAEVRAAGLRTRIATLAYSFYTEPPGNMSFARDTLVEFCPINQDYSRALSDRSAPANATYYSQLRGWLAGFPGEVTRYSYYAKYSWRSLPVVLPQQIATDIRHGSEIGEVGTSLYCEPANWLALEVNQLVYARASWHEHFDAERWYADYLRARFGAAADAMRRYYAAATKVSLGALVAESRDEKKSPVEWRPLVIEAQAALRDAASAADTPGAKWLIAKLVWQGEYLSRAVELRRAEVAGDKPAEAAVRRAINELVAAHANDGTVLDRGYGFRAANEEPAP